MKKMKCKHCGQEFSDQPNGEPVRMYEHEGEAICHNCVIGEQRLPDHRPEDHNRLIVDGFWYYTKNG